MNTTMIGPREAPFATLRRRLVERITWLRSETERLESKVRVIDEFDSYDGTDDDDASDSEEVSS